MAKGDNITQTANINFRTNPELVALIREVAFKEGVKASFWIRKCLSEALMERGHTIDEIQPLGNKRVAVNTDTTKPTIKVKAKTKRKVKKKTVVKKKVDVESLDFLN